MRPEERAYHDSPRSGQILSRSSRPLDMLSIRPFSTGEQHTALREHHGYAGLPTPVLSGCLHNLHGAALLLYSRSQHEVTALTRFSLGAGLRRLIPYAKGWRWAEVLV